MSEGLEVHPPKDINETPTEHRTSWGRELVRSIDDGYFLQFSFENLADIDKKAIRASKYLVGLIKRGN